METFGDRLRSEREERGLTIETVAQLIHVEPDRLLALERDDFTNLPDDAEMKACLDAYAGCLEVDAELMFEDYVQERDRCVRELDQAVTERHVGTASDGVSAHAGRRRRHSVWPVAFVVVGGLLLAGWWMFSGDGGAPTAEPPEAVAPAESQPVTTDAPVKTTPAPVETPATRPEPSTSTRSRLSVPDYGVGAAVEDRQLVGQSDTFPEGTQVWFWNRVQGGARGDTVHHVWLREGVEMTRVSLKIGGSSWRTYSKKTLHAGAVGEWAVETRDDAGRLLARVEFACVP